MACINKYNRTGNQCCHSVMNKNPEFTLKKTENDKKPQIYKTFKKSQNRT